MTRATVNGEARDLVAGATVDMVVRQLSRETRGVAVAVNGAVVSRGAWTSTPIRDGDAVEVLTAVQGG
jgi:sulfur carrier protein